MLTADVIRRQLSGRNTFGLNSPHFLEDFESDFEYVSIAIEDDDRVVPPLACSFSKAQSNGHMLASADENGYVCLYNTLLEDESAIKSYWQTHDNAVFDVTWMSHSNQLVTASGDQTAVLWNLDPPIWLAVFRGHSSSVRAVDIRPSDDGMLATASRDGHVMLWDHRCSLKADGAIAPVKRIMRAHCLKNNKPHRRSRSSTAVNDQQQSVTSVRFQSDDLLVSAGAGDGCIKVWDLRKSYSSTKTDPIPVHVFRSAEPGERRRGFTSLIFDSYKSRLFASCTDSNIYMYDFVNYKQKPVCRFFGHRNQSFYVKACLSPDNRFLLSGSDDGDAYIWQVDKPRAPPVVLKGHKAEVTDVSWCHVDDLKVATIGDDNSMRVWRVQKRSSPSRQSSASGTAERLGVLQSPMKRLTLHGKDSSPPTSTQQMPIHSWLQSCTSSQQQQQQQPSREQTLRESGRPEAGNENAAPTSLRPDKRASPRKQCKRMLMDSGDEDTLSVKKTCPLERKDYSRSSPRNPPVSSHSDSTPPAGPLLSRSPNKQGVQSTAKTHSATPSDRRNECRQSLWPSPTSNLPNFVLDGPCKVSSVQKSESSPDRQMDWLTKMRHERQGPERSTKTHKSRPRQRTCSNREISPEDVSPSLPLSHKTPIKGVKSILAYFSKE